MAKKITQKFPFLFTLAEKICVYSIALVPIVFLRSISTFAASKTLFIITASLLAFGAMASLWLVDRSYIPRIPKVLYVAGAYLLWVILTGIHGADPTVSFWATFERGSSIFSFIAIFLFSITLLAIIQKKDIRKSIANAFVWGGIILVCSKYVTMLFPGKTFILGDGGLMGNSSIAALYLLFPIASALYLLFTSEQKRSRVWNIIATVFLVASPFFVQFFVPHHSLFSFIGEARAACISLGIGGGAGVLLWLNHSQKKSMRVLSNIAVSISFIGLIATAIFFFNQHSIIRSAFIDAASPTRILYGEIAIQGTAEHPLLGLGWNTYPLVYEKYFNPINLTSEYLKEGWVDKPHNMILEIASATGIPGLALYLALYGIILISCSTYIRKGYTSRTVGALFFGLFIAYFFQTLFLFEVAPTQYAFFIMLAWFFSYAPIQPRSDTRPLVMPRAVRTATISTVWIAVAAGIVYFAYLPAREGVRIKNMFQSSITERTEQTAAIYALSPIDDGGAERSRILSLYIAKYLEISPTVAHGDKSAIQEELKVYLSLINDAINRSKTPYFRDYLTASMTANDIFVYSIDKQRDAEYVKEARQYAAKAMELSPYNQLGYLEMAKTYVLGNDSATAIDYLERAVALAPAFPDAHTVLLNVIRSTGNTALFEKKLKEAQTAIEGFTFQ